MSEYERQNPGLAYEPASDKSPRTITQHLVGARVEGRAERDVVVGRVDDDGHDPGIRIRLEPFARGECGRRLRPGVDHHETRPAAQRERHQLVDRADHHARRPFPVQPTREWRRGGLPVGRK